jgi:hypothetical protein
VNIKYLINLVKAGKRPIIEINSWDVVIDGEKYENTALEVCEFSPGQRARVTDVSPEDDIWLVYLDMSEFYELNCQLDEGNFYGPENGKFYKWHELSSYPKDHKTKLCVDETIVEFKLVDNRATYLIDEWTADKSSNLSYVEWLEAKILGEIK